MPLRLDLLDGFAVDVDGDSLRLWPSAQRLIAWLAVVHRSRHVLRVTVADRLWPDASPTKGASSLRSTLWRLPRTRGRSLVLSNASDLWLTPELEVDLWRAEEIAGALCVPDAVQIDPTADYTVLRRELLPDWDETWLAAEQESYRQKRLHALERAAGSLCASGRFAEALDASLAAVRSEPLRESAQRRVIEVHLAEGNHSEAIRQFDGYRRLLASELGIHPSPTIHRLVAPLLGRPADVPSEEPEPVPRAPSRQCAARLTDRRRAPHRAE